MPDIGKKALRLITGGSSLYSDIFIEERAYSQIHYESGRVEKVESAADKGVGMYIIAPWKTFYASTTSLDDADVLSLAQELGKTAETSGNGFSGEFMDEEAVYPFSIQTDPRKTDLGRKLELVRSTESMARKMEPRIKQARVVYMDADRDIVLYTSEGKKVHDRRTQVVLNILLVGEHNGEMQTAYEAIGGFYGFEFFTEEKIEEVVGMTVRRLAGLLQAKEAPMGTKTIVLAAQAGGTMIHEAIGHGLEADLAMEGLSCYKGMIGEQIASDLVDVVDDATIPHMRGTYAYDDEGVPSQKTVLVHEGVLKNYLYDRFHALKYGKAYTGNGRRESFRYKPIPRMSNTMILPGMHSPGEIIASVDQGVYVVKMGGGQVDTVTGDFVFEIQEGYLISDGAVGDMIRNATMMGSGPDVLKQIDMVGNDIGFGIGTCGKDGQGVPVSDAQPTIRIPRIVIGGRQE